MVHFHITDMKLNADAVDITLKFTEARKCFLFPFLHMM